MPVYALVWEKTGKVIGHVIFHDYEKDSYEIGWIVHKDYWGKGIASEVTASLIEYARAQELDSCIIECDPRQTASVRIAEKYGCVYENEEDDCVVYRLTL